MANLPDIPALANWTRNGNDCLLQQNKLLAPNELEFAKDKVLQKGQFCPNEFESHTDDRMHVFFLNSPTVAEGVFQSSGVGFYVRKGKVWAIFECGSLVPE